MPAELVIRDLHATVEGKPILQRRQSDNPPGRSARAHGTKRLR